MNVNDSEGMGGVNEVVGRRRRRKRGKSEDE